MFVINRGTNGNDADDDKVYDMIYQTLRYFILLTKFYNYIDPETSTFMTGWSKAGCWASR